jgi:pyruvate, water dikinase
MSIASLELARDVAQVGGKAAQLGALLRFGMNVPAGFVITAEGVERWDNQMAEEAIRRFDELGVEFVAVRSSAVAEDSSDASWAGLFDTFLFVDRERLVDKIESCIASASSKRSASYGRLAGQSGWQKIAVIIQAMIPSDISGVCFSVHPVTQSSNQIVIEAAYGLGEAVASGEVTPDNYVVSRQPREIVDKSTARQPKRLAFSTTERKSAWQNVKNPNSQKLNDEQILEVAAAAEKLEQYFGYPVDIEWAFHQNQLYILQSRPITTLR